MKILVLNSGSSSQKMSLYDVREPPAEITPMPLWEGRIEWSGNAATITVRNSKGAVRREAISSPSSELLRNLLPLLWSGETRILNSRTEIEAEGHRVVHGGPNFQNAVRITGEVYDAIADLSQFAPLHIQSEIEGMTIIKELLGNVPQFAIFDTGFYRDMPAAAQTYPGPYQWVGMGIRRYGFHGISHQYCAARTAQLLRKDLNSLKIVSCHLGNGCSVTGIRGGAQRRYYDGIHSARRTDDGHAFGFCRSGNPDFPDAKVRILF